MPTPPPPPSRPPLPDRWNTRDFPFLLELARALDANGDINQDAIAADLHLTEDDINAAWHALREGGYLRTLDRPRRLGDGRFAHLALTERGRRAVGLWPSERSGDALVDLFRQAADLTDDPEEKSRLRAAAGAIMSIGRDITADLGAAWVRSQTGL